MRLLFPFAILLHLANLTAQVDVSNLRFYADAMVNTYEPQHRIRTAKEFQILFDDYVSNGQYKTDDWQAVEGYTNVVTSEDEAITIVTYQVDTGEYPYTYDGYVITQGGAKKLSQTTGLDLDSEYMTYTPEDWYGALYYDIKMIDKNAYLIFGFNQYKEYDGIKIADVIVVEGDDVTFGNEAFELPSESSRNNLKSRILVSYSTDTNVSMNFNEDLNMVVYDHVTPRQGQQPGQGNTYVPDGTYEGFKLQNGKLVYQEKIFDHQYEEAPRPEAILDTDRSKDILGGSANKTKKKRRK